MQPQQLQHLIRDAGKSPVERLTNYTSRTHNNDGTPLQTASSSSSLDNVHNSTETFGSYHSLIADKSRNRYKEALRRGHRGYHTKITYSSSYTVSPLTSVSTLVAIVTFVQM